MFNDNRLGLVDRGRVLDVTSVLDGLAQHRYPLPRHDVFVAGLSGLRPLIDVAGATARSLPLSELRLLSPVMNPGKVIAAPFNYRGAMDLEAHAQKIRDAGLFLKASGSVVGAGDGIAIGRPEQQTDYEVELAVVIGRPCAQVHRDAALDYVAGYTIGLDITLHGPQERSLRKSLDSYTVLGPVLVTADEISECGELELGLDLNGTQRQRANTRDLVLDVPALIEYASAYYTLQPGDILLTGSPSGVDAIRPGDSIRAWIEHIGELHVAVR